MTRAGEKSVLLIELNEVNFDFVRRYGEAGKLPTLNRLIEKHGLHETTSEIAYQDLEPWIQWVTAHTGKSLAEHGVFRLGDIVNHDIPQIWESLEDEGLRVGAMSPMNAKNRTRDAAFFVPDPWTSTPITGSPLIHAIYSAVAQAVNDNAASKITLWSAAKLVMGLAAYARPENYARYVGLARRASRRSWLKPAFLDLLLADIFIRLVREKKPDFASLFINAGAHVQHHYMFSSGVYRGEGRNPPWYVPEGADPILDVYSTYDVILEQLEKAFPESRLMLATGLHQEPYAATTYYWRLYDHAAFLSTIGVPFVAAHPRMSRDFVIECSNADQALEAESILRKCTADGLPLFEVDNRRNDLFVTLEFPHEITETTEYLLGNRAIGPLRPQVNFVAIKNGEHDGVGYFLDTGLPHDSPRQRFPLKTLPSRIRDALGLNGDWPVSDVVAAKGPSLSRTY